MCDREPQGMRWGNHGQLPASFFELIRSSERPVLAEFWAEWCGPCRNVTPAIERLAREYSGRLLTVKVNVDAKPLIAQAYQVQGIPTIMLFWKGEPRMRLTGAYPYEALKQTLEQNWPRDAGARSNDSGATARSRPGSPGFIVP